jgi:hypothetical protein
MADIRTPLLRLQRSIRRRGAAATLRHIGAVALRRRHQDDAQNDFVRDQDGTFDLDYHVETAGFVPINNLKTVGRHRADAVDYQATSPVILRDMLAELSIDFARYTFIDVGAGKGRAILLAAGYSFRKIIGVEFAPSLCDVARRNLETYTGPRLCTDIEVVCADVDDYEVPPGPIVYFLYNTFAAAMMARFASKVLGHCRGDALPSFVLYCSPEHARVYRDERFSTLASTDDYLIYCLQPAPSREASRA